MRKTLTAATILLGSLTALPATANTTWPSGSFSLQGGNPNTCNIARVSATHNGSALSEIRVTLRNRGTQSVRLDGTALLVGTNQSKTGTLASVFIPAGGQATTSAGYPFGGALSGTTLRVTIVNCRAATA